MTEYLLHYHIRRKVSFQARDLEHAQAMSKSVVNTIHRGIKPDEFVILGIETVRPADQRDESEEEKRASSDPV